MMEIGQLVYSKRGRDKGNLFVIVSLDSEYAYLSDGSTRKLDRPKKKKHKHIQVTNEVSHELQGKLMDKSGCLKDADLRKVLSERAILREGSKEEVKYLV